MSLDNIEGVKEGCEGDVQSEILAGGDWTRCCSPPLTPGTFSITSLKNDYSLLEMIIGTDQSTNVCVGSKLVQTLEGHVANLWCP